MPESMVEVAKVTKVYQRGKQKIEVLHGLDLDIPKGDFVALMGPSGSGKTTLLNLIGGLDQPTSGEVRVGGRSEEHTSELQSLAYLVCRLLLEKKKNIREGTDPHARALRSFLQIKSST